MDKEFLHISYIVGPNFYKKKKHLYKMGQDFLDIQYGTAVVPVHYTPKTSTALLVISPSVPVTPSHCKDSFCNTSNTHIK